jgi:sacsin
LQVTPALARKLLASNATQLAQTLQRQQQRWQQQQQQQQQQAVSQPPAAVLLQYCMSDVSNATSSSNAGPDQHLSSTSSSSSDPSKELLGALRQLHGLPLLPAADGSLQTIQLQTTQQMHSNRQAVVPGSIDAAAFLYVPADKCEQQLLSQLPGQLLHPSVCIHLQQLLQIAAAGVSNVRLITCRSLDEHILPQLLPPAWHGQLEVIWSAFSSSSSSQESAVTTSTGDADHLDEAQQPQPQQQQQQREPSREFITLLWQWLGQRSDAAELAHWPVLPVAGGKLRLLQQPAQVRQEAWHAQGNSVAVWCSGYEAVSP